MSMWKRPRYWFSLLGMCLLATCPSAKRACDRRAHSLEADVMLDYLENRLRDRAAAGTPWPAVSAPLTPPRGSCCDQGGKCTPDRTQWLQATWRELKFAIDEPHYFSYEYIALQDGTVVLRAIGDIDCNSKSSTIERTINKTIGGDIAVKTDVREE